MYCVYIYIVCIYIYIYIYAVEWYLFDLFHKCGSSWYEPCSHLFSHSFQVHQHFEMMSACLFSSPEN